MDQRSTDASPNVGEGRLARIQILAPISIVVPTFREAENLPALIERLDALRAAHDLRLELLIVDDDSRDGTAEAVAASGRPWVTLVVRTADRGLSAAVLEGMRRARHDVIVCMDADLSHPPEKLPDLIMALETGQQFAIGSRYVPGGSTDHDWGIFRYVNSRVATLLARPLTDVRDPMSGFFAIRRRDFERAEELSPIGYKIGLELIVKCRLDNVGEVPIHFSDRVRGESKLSLAEQLRYVEHLRRLYTFRLSRAKGLTRFLAVGATGVIVNLIVLSLVLAAGGSAAAAIVSGVVVSLIGNVALHRRFVGSAEARGGEASIRMTGFLVASIVGAIVNVTVAIVALGAMPIELRGRPYLAAIAGIAAGTLFNFVGNRYVAFKRRYTTRPARAVTGTGP